jgi:hypothetical protein
VNRESFVAIQPTNQTTKQPTICESVPKSFRTESITKYTLTTINTRWEETQRVMSAKLTRLTHKAAIQLHLVAESCTICSSRSRRPVRKLLDTPFYASIIISDTNRLRTSVQLTTETSWTSNVPQKTGNVTLKCSVLNTVKRLIRTTDDGFWRVRRFFLYYAYLHYGSRGSSVSIVTRLQAGRIQFDSRHRQWRDFFFLFATASRPVLGPIQPPIRWVPGPISPWV